MSFFYEIEYLFRKRFFYAEYFFEMFFFKIFVIKQKNYLKDIKMIEKQDQFFLYFSSFIKFFFCLIEKTFNDIFYFLKGNFIFLKNSLKKRFLNEIKEKKKFLINDLYNSFSTKILISSTAFFILYLIIIISYIYFLHFNIEANSSFLFSKIKTKNILYENFPLLEECKFMQSIKEIVKMADEEYLKKNEIAITEFRPVVFFSQKSSEGKIVFESFIMDSVLFNIYNVFAPGLIPEDWLEEHTKESNSSIFETEEPLIIENYCKFYFNNYLKANIVTVRYHVADFYDEIGIYKNKKENLNLMIQEKLYTKQKLSENLNQILKNNGRKSFNLFKKNYIDSSNGHFYFKDVKFYIQGKSNFSTVLNTKFISKMNLLVSIICLINILHTLIAFLSLGYDYLLKKLTIQNILILYFISSTTLQIFLKISFIFFLW